MSVLEQLQNRYRASADPLRSERRLELLVIALAALLLLQLVFSLLGYLVAPSPEPLPPTADSLRVGAVSERALVTGSQSAEIRSRPLFFEGRRPDNPSQAVVEAPPPKRGRTKTPKLTLVGVFGARDTQGIIALHEGKRLRLHVGEEVSGWTLSKVSGGRATLSKGAESWSVALQRTDTGITAVEHDEPAQQMPEDKKPPPDGDVDTPARQPGGLTLGGRQ